MFFMRHWTDASHHWISVQQILMLNTLHASNSLTNGKFVTFMLRNGVHHAIFARIFISLDNYNVFIFRLLSWKHKTNPPTQNIHDSTEKTTKRLDCVKDWQILNVTDKVGKLWVICDWIRGLIRKRRRWGFVWRQCDFIQWRNETSALLEGESCTRDWRGSVIYVSVHELMLLELLGGYLNL